MNEKVIVSFSNDERKEGVNFPKVEMGQDEYGNIKFKCTQEELVEFISNNTFQVQQTYLLGDNAGKQNDILSFGTVMGQYWNSEEEYNQFKIETADCY